MTTVAVATALVTGLIASAAGAVSIPPGPVSALPGFTGSAFSRQPVTPTIAPQNPFLARQPEQQRP